MIDVPSTRSEAKKQNPGRFGWFAVWTGIVGFLLGFLGSTLDIWPEFFRRLQFSLNGGKGESSDWGEPLFYAALFGVPWGAVTALSTVALGYVVKLIRNRRNGAKSALSVRLLTTMTTPHDNLILFDGVCNFCTSSVQFILRHDNTAVFKFASIQSDVGREIYRTYGLDPNDIQTFLVLTKGRALLRSDAAIEVARQFGGLWRLFIAFKVIPRELRDWAYSFVARHRYHWFGRRDTCMIPSEDVRRRFLA